MLRAAERAERQLALAALGAGEPDLHAPPLQLDLARPDRAEGADAHVLLFAVVRDLVDRVRPHRVPARAARDLALEAVLRVDDVVARPGLDALNGGANLVAL